MELIDCFNGEYAFLSNFYNSPIIDSNGNYYPTVEHAFQAQKTLDSKDKYLIANASTPGQAKKLGRKIKLRKDWNNIKENVMYTYVYLKFQLNPELKEKLLATNDKILIEGNYWHDNEWGNCICPKCQNIIGENKLGKILMRIREELK